MAKKIIIIALIIIILIISGGILFFSHDSVDIFIDGENITVKTTSLSNIDKDSLNNDICDYTMKVMNNTTSDISTYKTGVENICKKYGMENAEINLDSTIGKNQIPVLVKVDGTSMLPTLQDGQTALANKTHDIHVGDIVIANSSEYGLIIKRVDQVNNNEIHLISDNKNVSYEKINGIIYEIKGITTWVDINEINGVVIDY